MEKIDDHSLTEIHGDLGMDKWSHPLCFVGCNLESMIARW